MAGMGATTTAPWSPVYPPALATPITSETLAAVRALTAWVLQRERATQAGSLPPAAPDALRQQLEALLERQQTMKAQQDRLLNLVAGTGALKTWLAQLNRLALKQGVAILQVEPQPVEVYTPPPPPAEGAQASTAPPPAAGDPLLAPNLEKRSAIVTLQGPFPRLVALLQQTELLQVIVLASDLELDVVPPKPDSQQVETKLKLKLSAYGRSAKAAS